MNLSVAIITLNAARTLEKTLQSLPHEAQIIVLDSGSTDSTQNICQKYGAQFYFKKWNGFGPQRNAATALCIHPWILYLDADEWLSPGLKEEIEKVSETPALSQAFRMRRLSCLDGKMIKHGDWASDYVTRLAPKQKCHWIGDEPHPRLDEVNLTISTFKNPLLHDPYADREEYEKKICIYALHWAMSEHKRGKKPPPQFFALVRALWRWLRCYMLRLGFLDGRRGWLIAKMSAKMVIYKYRHLQNLSTHTHS